MGGAFFGEDRHSHFPFESRSFLLLEPVTRVFMQGIVGFVTSGVETVIDRVMKSQTEIFELVCLRKF